MAMIDQSAATGSQQILLPGWIVPPLKFMGSWRSEYTRPLQDVRFYDFGQGERALVSRDSEGFALVKTMTGNPRATTLVTTEENVDGWVADTAALYDAATAPGDCRMWVAHGRLRSAVRLSDFERVNDEDRFFSATGLAVRETPLALEVDEDNGLLWTLTQEGGLYCEDITDPSAPVQAAAPLLLGPLLLAGESPLDLKLWTAAGEEVAVVLTTQRVLTISYGTLALLGASDAVTPAAPRTDTNPVAADSITPLLIIANYRLAVFRDSDGAVVAAVASESRAYELPAVTRPFARLVVMCDLDLAGGYAAPLFRRTAMDGSTFHVLYNPFPVPPAEWADLVAAGGYDPIHGLAYELKAHYSVAAMQVVDTGSTQTIYMAHGRRRQVQALDVSHVFSAPLPSPTEIVCHPNYAADPHTAQDISHLRLDPADPDRMVVLEQFVDGARVVNLGTASNQLLSGARFNEGGQRDICTVALPGAPFVVVSLDYKQVEFMLRVIDASADTPDLLHEGFWSHTSDGMVAIPPDHLFGCTFGGVVRFARQGISNRWLPVPSSYQPNHATHYPPNWYREPSTEWIEIGRDVTGPGDDRLYICAPGEGVMEFALDPLTKNPGPARHITMPALPHAALPGWADVGIGTYYSNQVAYVVVGGVPYVVCDYVNRLTSDYALLVWRLDVPTDTWSFAAAGLAPTGLAQYTIRLSDHVHITEVVGGRQFAVIDSWSGFVVFRIDTLATTGLVETTHVVTIAGLANQCYGVTTSGSTMFVVTLGPRGEPSTTARVTVYPFDPQTGRVDLVHPIQVFDSTSLTLPAGHSWVRVFSTRFRVTDENTGAGTLYLCTDAGTLLELGYTPPASP